MSLALILVLLLTLFAAPALALPDAGPVPTIFISLDPLEQKAEVTMAQLGTVEFQGTVEIDQPRLMTSVLTLTCVVNTGWPVETDPNGTEVTGPMTIQFTTTVIVPPATSSLLTGNVMVTGSLKAPGLAPVLAQASAVVTVDQYYVLRIEAEEPLKDLERGESDETELNVYNDGNGQDTIKLSLMDVPEGMRIGLNSNQATIQPREFVTIVLDINVGNDSPGGMNTVIVRAVSSESGGDYYRDYPIHIKVNTMADNFKAPGLPVSFVILAILAVTIFVRKRTR